jgi:hypothetical protein
VDRENKLCLRQPAKSRGSKTSNLAASEVVHSVRTGT